MISYLDGFDVWNALLTKKLPMFLWRLNEIDGDCKSFYQYWDHFEVILVILILFQNDGFYCLAVRVKCESEWNPLLFSF